MHARTGAQVNAAEEAGVMSETHVLFKDFDVYLFASEDKRSLIGLRVPAHEKTNTNSIFPQRNHRQTSVVSAQHL